jgi:hypothetical protein
MRTTITIDEEILEQLKARAANEGTTVSRLIEDSVRLAASSHREDVTGETFKLVTFGKGGRFTSLDIDHVSALIEQDDVARHGRGQ